MTAQQLKNSILQMAVQGKLVPQDPNDEPASILLERIRAEKEQMVKEGKIKKEKNPSIIVRGDDNLPYEKVGENDPVCIADEVPFEIPDSWEWVKLGDLFYVQMGQSPKGDSVSEGGDGIEFHQGKVFFGSKYLLMSNQSTNCPTRLAPPNSVLLCVRAPVGKVNITEREICIGRGLCSITPLSGVPIDFVYYLLETYEEIFIKQATGTTFAAITGDVVKNQLIPLPPLAEQRRIIAKIEEVIPSIDQYNCAETKIEDLNRFFPDNLKKSILQQAVQGKLVPQDPADEPASVLLERIRTEKEQMIKDGRIKRGKQESVIYRKADSFFEEVDGVERCIDDEIPFEIPNSWQWCRLKSVVNIVSARRVHQSDWQTRGIPFYRAREIAKLAENGYVENELFISEKLYNEYKKSGVPHPGDLMVTAVGTLGKTYVVRPSDRFYYKDASVICFENFAKLSPLYVQLVMQTPFMETIITGNSSGTTVGTITIIKANEYLIPIPPLPEQERIVEKARRLLSMIKDNVEK